MSLRILHYSDVEGALDDPESVGRLVGAVEGRRDPGTLVLGTGDVSGPSVLSSVTDREVVDHLFDALDPDASTFGNHDFDDGIESAKRRVARSPQPWLVANLFDGDGDPFGASAGVERCRLVSVGSIDVGLVGVITPELPEMAPAAASLRTTDPVDAANEAAATLRENGAEIVVVLAHVGWEELPTALEAAVVLDGHAHTTAANVVEGTAFTRPGVNGSHVAEVRVGPDCDPEATLHATVDAPVDERAAAGIRKRLDETGLSTVVDTVDEPIPRTETERMEGRSRITGLVADAIRWVADADVAVIGSASIRSGDPLSGDVTELDVRRVVPFDEPVDVASIGGDRLRETLRQLKLRTRYPGADPRQFGDVSGATLTYDDRENEVRDVRIGGEPLHDDRTYEVASVRYLFETDHVFSTFDAGDRIRTHEVDPVVEYVRAEGVAGSEPDRVARPYLGSATEATPDH